MSYGVPLDETAAGIAARGMVRLLCAVVFAASMAAADKNPPQAICDGNVCMERMVWKNYYAGCLGCLEWVIEGTIINKSEFTLQNVTLSFDIMSDEKTIIRNSFATIETILPNGGRWEFRSSVGRNTGRMPKFARPSRMTVTARDTDGIVKTVTSEVNLGAVRVK